MIPTTIPNTRKFIGTVRIYVIYDNECFERPLVNGYYSMHVIKHRIFYHDNYNLQVPVVSK